MWEPTGLAEPCAKNTSHEHEALNRSGANLEPTGGLRPQPIFKNIWFADRFARARPIGCNRRIDRLARRTNRCAARSVRLEPTLVPATCYNQLAQCKNQLVAFPARWNDRLTKSVGHRLHTPKRWQPHSSGGAGATRSSIAVTKVLAHEGTGAQNMRAAKPARPCGGRKM